MAALTRSLPNPKFNNLEAVEDAPAPSAGPVRQMKAVPPYGKRANFMPRSIEDFGDGGAFPEIHVAQYPLEMGRKNKQAATTTTLALTTDATGKVNYAAALKAGHRKDTKIFSSATDLVAKRFEKTDDELARPDMEVEEETTMKTRNALEAMINKKIAAAQPAATAAAVNQGARTAPKYIQYTPAQQGAGYNSGAQHRMIKMVEQQKDPLEPPKFKHKKCPPGPPSPPVPVMHSPPRKLTHKDQQDWKIPPCISNWKNAKGYTIPLDKRLAADGRGLQEVQINDAFAKLSESLLVAERHARDEVDRRAMLAKKKSQIEKEKREEALRKVASKLRDERMGMAPESNAPTPAASSRDDDDERYERKKRDELREERKRERERDRRMEHMGTEAKKSKLARDRDRDIGEKIALGQAKPTASEMFDQRLYNQSEGMSSGFGEEDGYTVYDKPMFAGTSSQSLYRPKGRLVDEADEDEAAGGGNDNSVLSTSKFKAHKEFAGTGSGGQSRSKPVEFEKEDEPDPFGLDEFLTDVRKKSTKSSGKGAMHAAAGGGGGGESSNRSRIDFRK